MYVPSPACLVCECTSSSHSSSKERDVFWCVLQHLAVTWFLEHCSHHMASSIAPQFWEALRHTGTAAAATTATVDATVFASAVHKLHALVEPLLLVGERIEGRWLLCFVAGGTFTLTYL